MLITCLSTQIKLQYVLKMSAFGTYSCFESCTSLVDVDCALFNARSNAVYRRRESLSDRRAAALQLSSCSQLGQEQDCLVATDLTTEATRFFARLSFWQGVLQHCPAER